MGPDSWTVIGTGVVILVAMAVSNRSMRKEFREDLKRLEERITEVERVLRAEVKRLDERITAVETRLAEVVGTLKGMHKSMFDRGDQ